MGDTGLAFARDIHALGTATSVIDTGLRFPAVPFRGLTGNCWVLAFDDILGSRFSGRLMELAAAFGDQAVEVVAADQDAEEWLRHQGVLPGFIAPVDSLVDTYLKCMWKSPDGSIGWELGHVANDFALVGSSGKWALWAQRDWEIGLLVTTGDFQLAASEDAPFVLPGEDFEMWRGPAGWTLELTPAMLEEFKVNVRALTD